MRCRIGWLVAVCLLLAGVTPARADRERDRPNDELTAVTAIVKLAGRRQDARTHGAIGIVAFVLVANDAPRPPPCAWIELVFATPTWRWLAVTAAFDARGPPLG